MSFIKTIQREFMRGGIGVGDAISQIDFAIGGITRVDFKDGKKFKVTNHNQMFPLDYDGVRRREQDRLYALAVGAYFKAKENGSRQPGEVHISREASTKHHMDGIYRIWEKYTRGY